MNGSLLRHALLGLVAAITPIDMALSADLNDNDPGRLAFESMCATCHGTNARGNGPSAKQLTVAPPDLTVLARQNNGVLPITTVYEIIDGRKVIESHGTREMPIWGAYNNSFLYPTAVLSGSPAADPKGELSAIVGPDDRLMVASGALSLDDWRAQMMLVRCFWAIAALAFVFGCRSATASVFGG
jgi:mono/diheme cytochrome c family protein